MLNGNIYYEYINLKPDQVGRIFNEGIWKLSMNIFLDKSGLLVIDLSLLIYVYIV